MRTNQIFRVAVSDTRKTSFPLKCSKPKNCTPSSYQCYGLATLRHRYLNISEQDSASISARLGTSSKHLRSYFALCCKFHHPSHRLGETRSNSRLRKGALR